jgi:hypothetical protein
MSSRDQRPPMRPAQPRPDNERGYRPPPAPKPERPAPEREEPSNEPGQGEEQE